MRPLIKWCILLLHLQAAKHEFLSGESSSTEIIDTAWTAKKVTMKQRELFV